MCNGGSEKKVPAFVGREPADQTSEQANASASGGPESNEPSVGWTPEDLKALADEVYELLLRDLMLERERGAW